MKRAGSRCRLNCLVPLQLAILRELVSSTRTLTSLNWRIVRGIITSKDGPDPLYIDSFTSTKSCSNIIYNEGHLLVQDVINTKGLEVFCFNGTTNGYFLKAKVTLPEAWKDREFGISSVILERQQSQNHASVGFKTALYFITARNLYCLDTKKGVVTQNVALPEGQKFSDLSIDDETQLLAVSSHKNGSSKLDVLMLFALYDIFPQLVFRQLLEIKRSVFGNSVTGAEISQGILITLHRGNLIRSYSLNDACSFERTASPVLFETTSFNHIISIGASPFHMIEALDYRTFRVWNLDTEQLLDGVIEGNEDSFNSGLCFHPDESPRLIFTDYGALRVYNIGRLPSSKATPSLVSPKVYSLNPAVSDCDLRDSIATVTSSGRTVKRPAYSSTCVRTNDMDEGSLLAWDYESDMDLLGVVYARPEWYRGQNHINLFLDLIDSFSGRLLRRVQLGRSYQGTSHDPSEMVLKLDADMCIVSISRNSRASILVYRFVRNS